MHYLTSGESHGKAVTAIVSGVPAGLTVDAGFIDEQLRRRQGGYGRGARQRIESDRVEILSGIRGQVAIGSPITLVIHNADARLDDQQRTPPIHVPRPGHADLAGAVKYLSTDCRPVLERASARETAPRVAAGAVARLLLRELGIQTFGFVRAIGGREWPGKVSEENHSSLSAARDASETYCPDTAATSEQVDIIRQAKVDKDTIGGIVETHVFNCPPGIGSTMDWRDRLDSKLAAAVMGVQAIKCVEIGLGKEVASRPGSQVHDPIEWDRDRIDTHSLGFTRPTNNAGGIEGGMSNGAPIVVRAAMKPISTLLRGMPSVDLTSGTAAPSAYERSDICAVPAASVVVEHVVAFEVARALLEKFPSDTMDELRNSFDAFLRVARALPLSPPRATLA
ncbi:MAG: chorismate synthase [Phycisphaeraceae bacterium]|nr:chorismate synthase [Phycisphaeraceae bacterium]